MQIPKSFVLLWVAAVGLTPLYGAADNEAQQKAREALRQKLGELQAQPRMAAPGVPAMSSPAPTTRTDAEGIARAREALRQKLNEPAPRAPSASSSTMARPPVATITRSTPSTAAPPADEANIAKARQALEQKINELQGGVSTPSQPADEAARAKAQEALSKFETQQQAGAESAKARTGQKAGNAGQGFAPVQSPGLPISTEKQQRLSDLLRLYQADAITPEQYHAERKKILSQP